MPLTRAEKDTLLMIARSAIETYVNTGSIPEVDPPSPSLSEDSGAFVSIHKWGRLRGCIGTFASPNPLFITVRDMAVAAASKDPRFAPLEAAEIEDISLEISVLSPLKEIKDLSEIEVGRHGLYIMKGKKRGVLLPQVAIEHGFDRETFLDNTCLKAGLEPDDWRDGATIFTFEAEIVKEDRAEGRVSKGL